MKPRIYHNPRCSKSRATLALLEEAGHDVEIVEYLKTPVDKRGLKRLLRKLGVGARDIVRRSEPEFKSAGIGDDASDDELLDLIVEHPGLMQRPIVETETQARIGRPPEQVLELFR